MGQIADTMQMGRRHDEIVFGHAMDDVDFKAHLERSVVPGDCQLCEWFKRSLSKEII